MMQDSRETLEREVLGRIILGANPTDAPFTAKEFSGSARAWIFARILALAEKGDPIEPSSIVCGCTAATGIHAEIAECLCVASSSAHLPFYSRELQRILASERRAAIQKEAAAALGRGEDVRAVLGEATDRLDRIDLAYGEQAEKTLADSAFELFRAIEEGKPRPDTVSTYLKAIDSLAVGLLGGDLVILAGRPSMGKTALAITMMAEQSRHGIPPAFFSLEQSGPSVAARILARVSGRPTTKALRRPDELTMVERDSFYGAFSETLKIAEGIFLFERPRQTVAEIEVQAAQAVRRGAKIIYVDYLQKIRFPGKDRHDLEIGDACKRLRAIGQTWRVPVVLLAQINRGVEKDNRPPRLSDLKDSGEIEQDADFVWFLHCPEAEAKQSGEKWLIQEKGRDAGIGRRKIFFKAESVSFYDMEDAQ